MMGNNKKVYTGKKDSRCNPERASSSKITKRRPVNRYYMEGESESVSTSSKKLKMSQSDYGIHVDGSFGYRFIDFLTVFTTIYQLVACIKCGTKIKFS